jgi:hypothetical protein
VQNTDRLELCDALKDVVVPAWTSDNRKKLASVPHWLKVAGIHEWPDYWVSDHRRSLVLALKGDVRCALTPSVRVAFAIVSWPPLFSPLLLLSEATVRESHL